MNSILKIVATTLTVIGLTVGGGCIAIRTLGNGTNSYLPATAFFPFAVFVTFLWQSSSALAPVALVQFPLYGAFVGRAWLKNRAAHTVMVIGIIHAAGILACLVYAFLHHSV